MRKCPVCLREFDYIPLNGRCPFDGTTLEQQQREGGRRKGKKATPDRQPGRGGEARAADGPPDAA